MKSALTNSLSPTISSISYSPIRSPIVIIACLKSAIFILPSWSESNTFNASIKSYSVSLSFPRFYTTVSRLYRLNDPALFGSTYDYISVSSVSVGFKVNARTNVPSSLVATWPRWVLSNSANISLISFDDKLPAI